MHCTDPVALVARLCTTALHADKDSCTSDVRRYIFEVLLVLLLVLSPSILLAFRLSTFGLAMPPPHKKLKLENGEVGISEHGVNESEGEAKYESGDGAYEDKSEAPQSGIATVEEVPSTVARAGEVGEVRFRGGLED